MTQFWMGHQMLGESPNTKENEMTIDDCTMKEFVWLYVISDHIRARIPLPERPMSIKPERWDLLVRELEEAYRKAPPEAYYQSGPEGKRAAVARTAATRSQTMWA